MNHTSNHVAYISAFVSPRLIDLSAGDAELLRLSIRCRSSCTDAGTALNSRATISVMGLGAILINATVSPHMMFVIGRRISTPAASRTTSPGSIYPVRTMGEPGVSGTTDMTRTTPSPPRFSLIPSESDKKIIGRSGPTCNPLGVRFDCCGHFLGSGGMFGVWLMA